MTLRPFHLSTNPHLLSVRSSPVFTPEDCEAIVGAASDRWQSARIVRDEHGTGNAVALDTRSVLTQPLQVDESGFPLRQLVAAVVEVNSAYYRFDLRGILAEDGLSVLKYEAASNDHYRPHRDYGLEHAYRKLTVIVQLTDADSYVGGDLAFPGQRVIAPRIQGQMIVFPSFLSHTVTPVVRGTRQCIVGWVHGPTLR